MDLLGLYARGLGIGFAIAAALGPIGLLCIRRTLQDGALVGLASGLGAATADTLYAAVAAFGLTAVSNLLVAERRPLGLVGGTFLILIAIRLIRTSPGAEPAGRPTRGLVSAYATTVGLTITNPATILSFAAAFVGFGLAADGGLEAVALVVGVLSGSAAWWAILAGGVILFRSRIGPSTVRGLSSASSGLIALIGLLAIGTSLLAS